MKRTAALVCLLLLSAPLVAQDKRPIEIDDLFRLKRVSDPQVSPDGQWVVYAVTTPDLEGNKSTTSLWLAPTDKGEPKQLTQSPKADRHPRWSPKGKFVLFESTRSGESQLWIIDTAGGEPRQLTSISTGASSGVWSRDGKHIAFVSSIWPEYSSKPFKESDALNKQRMTDKEKNPVKARVATRLFFRHWDEYVEDQRQHVFVMSFAGDEAGEPRGLKPGDRDAYPTSSTVSAGDELTFSPDGTHVIFTAPPKENEAWNTNYDIWRVPIDGGKPTDMTLPSKAADGCPRVSPDGKWLAFRSQKKPGFEADRWGLQVAPVDAGGRISKPRHL